MRAIESASFNGNQFKLSSHFLREQRPNKYVKMQGDTFSPSWQMKQTVEQTIEKCHFRQISWNENETET